MKKEHDIQARRGRVSRIAGKKYMQPGFAKDYSYLLSRIIPRHLLSSKRLEGVLRVLSGGGRLDIVREAYLSMEELTRKGVFRRKSFDRRQDGVSVTYAKVDGPTGVTLEMSRGEWEEVTGERRAPEGILPSVLAGIISSLSLDNAPGGIATRLEELLSLTGHIHHGAKGHVLLVTEEEVPPERDSVAVRWAAPGDLSQNGLYGPIVRTGKRHRLHRFSRELGSFPGMSLFRVMPGIETIVLVPLCEDERLRGILEVHLPERDGPDRDTVFNLAILGRGLIAILVNHESLEKMVSIDSLTRVHNRNSYESQVRLEIERAQRDKKELAFLMIDIDDFKKVNDVYGHDAGDSVLRLVAQAMKRHLRKIDLLFRYGGEEFIALLPGAGREPAMRTAERVREVVSELGVELDDGERIGVTISVGGCIYPTDAQEEAELFRKADKAMYLSKSGGKNRVTFYDGGQRANDMIG